MACKSCRLRVAQWTELKEEYDRLDPEGDRAAREKIKARAASLAARVGDCCGPAEAGRLFSAVWPEISI